MCDVPAPRRHRHFLFLGDRTKRSIPPPPPPPLRVDTSISRIPMMVSPAMASWTQSSSILETRRMALIEVPPCQTYGASLRSNRGGKSSSRWMYYPTDFKEGYATKRAMTPSTTAFAPLLTRPILTLFLVGRVAHGTGESGR